MTMTKTWVVGSLGSSFHYQEELVKADMQMRTDCLNAAVLEHRDFTPEEVLMAYGTLSLLATRGYASCPQRVLDLLNWAVFEFRTRTDKRDPAEVT